MRFAFVNSRFLNVPRTTMEKELKSDEKSISDDLAALQKKGKFLEKQYQEANSQLRDIVRKINTFSHLPATPRLKTNACLQFHNAESRS